ncbi:hypothetical protein KY358_02010 [Candidatus Woesearchaeota archaeon]|nr:hypothetical protein [Candidatus Woesearchaeota archaeon]
MQKEVKTMEQPPDSGIDYLKDIGKERCFWVNGGSVIKNLDELHAALGYMDEQTFNHHVNDDKNDIHNWIRDVIQDQKLADSISPLKTKEAMRKNIGIRIGEIKDLIKKEDMRKKQEKSSVRKPARKIPSRKVSPAGKKALKAAKRVSRLRAVKKIEARKRASVQKRKRTGASVRGLRKNPASRGKQEPYSQQDIEQKESKLYTVGGVVTSVLVLFALVAFINIGKEGFTGAATAGISKGTETLIGFMVAIAVIIIVISAINYFKKK